MKKFNFLILLICTYATLSGQHIINGTVTVGSEKKAIIGATIKVVDSDVGTVSNKDGQFTLELTQAEDVHLEISSVGFQTYTHTVTGGNSTSDIEIELKEKAFDLPQVVVQSVTMTGGLGNVDNIIGSAHYIGQKEIQRFSYTDINRTLRNIPGINIQEEDGYGLRPNIGLRATGSERSSKITVMEDGVLAAPAPYAAPAAYYFPTVGRMEAIEIMKGSSQVKYGPFTTGGAINLISTPIPMEFSGHADFIAGSDGYKMLHANLGNAHKNVAYMVETLQFSADGFKQLDGGGNTGFNKEDYVAKVRINTNPGAPIYQSLSFKIGQAQETSNETYLGLTDADFADTSLRRYAGSARDLMTTDHEQFSLTHFIEASSFLDIHTTAYRNNFSRNWYKLDKVNGSSISSILSDPTSYAQEMSYINGSADAQGALAVKANNRSYYSQGVQTNAIVHFKQGAASHHLNIGLRVHQDQIDRYQWVDDYSIANGIMSLQNSGQPGTESNRVETANAVSTFVQYTYEKEGLKITPGLRYENISMDRIDYGKTDPERVGTSISERSNDVSVFIPGVGVSYTTENYGSVFGGIHKGFAPPGSREGTLPEESWNTELGYRYFADGLTAQVTAYYNDYSNLLGSDLAATGGTGSQDLFNGGNAVAKGIEAQMNYNLLDKSASTIIVPLTLSYTYTNTTFSSEFESDFDAWGTVSEGDFLPYVPKHQLAMGFSVEHAKFLFDISSRYQTAMLTEAGGFDESIPITDEAFTVDIALNYRLSNQLSAFVNVNNATNNIYIVSRRPAGVRPNQPRVWNVGLKANF